MNNSTIRRAKPPVILKYTVLGYELDSKENVYINYLFPSVLGALFYVFYYTCDLAVFYRHLSEDNPIWASLTLFFMYLPVVGCFIMTVSSWELWPEMKSCNLTNFKWIVLKIFQHIFFPVWCMWRFAERIFWSIEASRIDDEEEREKALSVVGAPRTIELYLFLQGYLQTVPQMFLQLYILMNFANKIDKQTVDVQAASIFFNLTKMALVTSLYQRFKKQKIGGKNYPWYKSHKHPYCSTIDGPSKRQSSIYYCTRDSEKRLRQSLRSRETHRNYPNKQNKASSSDENELENNKSLTRQTSVDQKLQSTQPTKQLSASTNTFELNLIPEENRVSNRPPSPPLLIFDSTETTPTSELIPTIIPSAITKQNLETFTLENRAPTAKIQAPTATILAPSSITENLSPVETPTSENIDYYTTERDSIDSLKHSRISEAPRHTKSSFRKSVKYFLRSMSTSEPDSPPPPYYDERRRSSDLYLEPIFFSKEISDIDASVSHQDTILSDNRYTSLSQTNQNINSQLNENTYVDTLQNNEVTLRNKSAFDIPRRVIDITALPEDDIVGKSISLLWWFCFLAARIVAIASFAYFYPTEICWILGSHFILAVAFLIYDSQTLEVRRTKAIFFVFVGLLYLFCLIEFKVKFKKAKFWYYGFFTITYVENLTMCLVWFFANLEEMQEDWWFNYMFYLIIVFSILSLCSMLFYINVDKPKAVAVEEELVEIRPFVVKRSLIDRLRRKSY